MIDLKKKYQTRDGRRVELHGINDKPVTYPVQGTIYELVNVRYRKIYSIWSIKGKSQVVHQLETDRNKASDLIEICD